MGSKSYKYLVALALSVLLLGYQNCKNEFVATKPPVSGSQSLASNQSDSNAIQVAATWSNSLEKAMTIYQRLSTRVALDNPDIIKMKGLIEQGKIKEAALVAAETDNFYNITIRDFAAKMSNRELDPAAPLNDFTATIIGIAKDNIDARQMLTADFYYSGLKSASLTDVDNTIVKSNSHYEQLDETSQNLRTTLVRHPKQRAIINGTPGELPDAAGVITSRAFMSAHANAGTNRRLVEYSFSQFLCLEMSQWKTSTTISYVGRDVPRGEQFDNSCSLCHGPMDAMRPAFAYVDFIFDGPAGTAFYYQKEYTDTANMLNSGAEKIIPDKFRRNATIAPNGHRVMNDNWENLTNSSAKNAEFFQWRSSLNGKGLKNFGKMISESRAFSDCMVKRAFETVCYQKFPDNKALLSSLSDKFEAGNKYSLKDLFAEVAILDDCVGGD